MGALTSASATALARLIAEREVTAREAVAAHLRRMESVDRRSTPSCSSMPSGRSADAADDALGRDQPLGPLHGVPFTVKDTIAAAGIAMAMGAPERAGVVPLEDATVVARVRAAGGILLGKTNCPVYGGGIETENPVYGRTSNPYDLAWTPGGSGGGGGARRGRRHGAGGASPARRPRAHPRGLALLRRRRRRRRPLAPAAALGRLPQSHAPFAARYDLLVCPVFPTPARLHGTMNVPGELDPTS